ncbi:uncharacterized protein A1O5_13003, partial [Cladophialophora psammophila CBS 110553]
KRSGEIFQRQFTRVQARDSETLTKQAKTLISTFRHSKGVVNLQRTFFRFNLTTTTALLFGESIETL